MECKSKVRKISWIYQVYIFMMVKLSAWSFVRGRHIGYKQSDSEFLQWMQWIGIEPGAFWCHTTVQQISKAE